MTVFPAKINPAELHFIIGAAFFKIKSKVYFWLNLI